MRHYETTYILRPNLGEEQFTEIIERTNAIVTDDNGTVINVDRWGLKKLAYEIKKETQGYYICMNYAASGAIIQEIERIFRIDDRLLRYLTIKLADSIDNAGINEEKEKIAALAAAEAAEAEEREAGEHTDTDTDTDTDSAAADSDSAGSEKAPASDKADSQNTVKEESVEQS
ncbi:MAG: 30S ribosomal protein S6 [Candidatus Electrothrix sp. AR3]|nr:30S ribosomal protein S6 [Candidatus Electrothrix sp. AR3]